MSGGSWEYVYHKFNDVADRLLKTKMISEDQEVDWDDYPVDHPEQVMYRVRLGAVIKVLSDVMKTIEWVDSCDCSYPEDVDKIKKFFKNLEEIV